VCLGHRRASTFEDKEGGKGETHVRFSRTEEHVGRVVHGSSDSRDSWSRTDKRNGSDAVHLIKAR